MIFQCTDKNEYWSGEITNIKFHSSHYEAFIISRSSIYIVFGATTRGGFLCAPDFDVGCHLVSFNNIYWNKEMLIKQFGKVDGLTVFFALSKFNEHYKLF